MNEKNKKLLNPVKNIVMPYFIFGILWISFSDTTASYLLKDYISYQTIQSTKGILFVIVTGIFLYFLLK
ncbi:MAG: hypothetical protein UMU04_01110, partial [Halanaerobiales bacterium]|nr:hypothetical protein [Halanaerobiales bacterium]